MVLLAGDGWGSRAIAREVGCARGVVSRWRVRFATAPGQGLADAPRPGKPKTYGADAARRILALLDQQPPEGLARWTAPLLAKELGDVSDQHVWRFLRAQRMRISPGANPGVSRAIPSLPPRLRASSASTSIRPTMRSSSRSMRSRRSRPWSGRRGISSSRWPLAPRPGPRIQAARHDHAVCRPRGRHRRDPGQAYQAQAPPRVPRLHERGGGRPPRPADPRHSRQPQDHQAQAGSMAGPARQRSLPLHPDPRFLAQPGRDLVLDPQPRRA